MIKLENISAKKIIPYGDLEIQKLVMDTKATSVKDLLNLIKEFPEYNWGNTKEKCEKIEKLVNAINKIAYKTEVYYTKGYTNSDLLIQDKMNNGDILLLNNPTRICCRFSYLKGKSIAKIKSDLACTLGTEKNYVATSPEYFKIGTKNIPTLISAIEMFETQIERQATLTKERNINLFELNKETKLEITEAMYNEIINYLVYNTKGRLVWSNLSDTQKKLYISSTINKTMEDVNTRKNLKNYIANYTTLPELEQVANHDLKVLKRFIVR